jgi:hypothetical protein
MATKQIRHIDSIVMGTYVAGVNVILTIMGGILAFIMMIFVGSDIGKDVLELLTVLFFECIVSAILGFGGGLLISVIYNMLANKHGGIRLKVEDG